MNMFNGMSSSSGIIPQESHFHLHLHDNPSGLGEVFDDEMFEDDLEGDPVWEVFEDDPGCDGSTSVSGSGNNALKSVEDAGADFSVVGEESLEGLSGVGVEGVAIVDGGSPGGVRANGDS